VKEQREIEIIQLNKNQRSCKCHSDAICVYDLKKWPSGCPFCAAQQIINPELKDNSPFKNRNVRPEVLDEEDQEVADVVS
jgi:hypothetical protein